MKICAAALCLAASLASAGGYRMGIHRDGPLPMKDKEMERIFSESSLLGAQEIRLNLWWDQVEQGANNYDWGRLDMLLKYAEQYHIGVLLTVRGFQQMTGFQSDDEKYLHYASFVKEVFHRSAGKIHYFQFENELSDKRTWSAPYSDYYKLLKIVRQAQQETDKNAKIVFAGIASGVTEAAIGHQTRAKLRDQASETSKALAELLSYYDVVDLHLYHDASSIPLKIEWLRTLLNKDAATKEIVSTELGGPDLRVVKDAADKDSSYFEAEMLKRFMYAFSSGITQAFWHGLSVSSRQQTVFRLIPLMLEWQKRPQYATYKFLSGILARTDTIVTGVEKQEVRYSLNGSGGTIAIIYQNLQAENQPSSQMDTRAIPSALHEVFDLPDVKVYAK
jgi:hypothetical protein